MYNFHLRKQIHLERKRNRIVIFTFLLLLIAYLGITLVFEENGLLKYLELKNKKIELLSEIKALQEENIKLKEEIELIKKDPFYIEKKAREELNLSRPDEYIFLFEN